MAGHFENIVEALVAQVYSFTAVPALPLDMGGGVDFTAPTSGLWLEIQIVPGRVSSPFYGNDATKVRVGFLQIGVCNRLGEGDVAALVICDLLAAHFPVGLVMTSGGYDVEISAPADMSPGVNLSDHRMIPLRFAYRLESGGSSG
jgi:hypothetical protein